MDHARISQRDDLANDSFGQLFAPANLPREESPRIDPDVEVVLSSLFDAYKRLRTASYKIGYLEGQVRRYRHLLRAATAKESKYDTGSSEPTPQMLQEQDAVVAEKTWFSSIVEAVIGSEEPAEKNGRRGCRTAGNQNYYQLIRRSIEPQSIQSQYNAQL